MKPEENLEFLIQKFTLEPGEVCVIQAPQGFGVAQAERLRRQLKERFPANEFIVLFGYRDVQFSPDSENQLSAEEKLTQFRKVIETEHGYASLAITAGIDRDYWRGRRACIEFLANRFEGIYGYKVTAEGSE